MNIVFRDNHFAILMALFILPLSFLFFFTPGAQPAPPPDKPVEAREHNPKLSTTLEALVSTVNSSGSPSAEKYASQNGVQISRSDAITVIIEKEQGARINPQRVGDLGGEVLGRTANLVEIRIPVERLEALVERTEVLIISALPIHL
jgi:hypothetical protein